jgi:glycosyltransferase involved in cell wall biosynthesis
MWILCGVCLLLPAYWKRSWLACMLGLALLLPRGIRVSRFRCHRRPRRAAGLVLVEGMACGLPVIAAAAHGPSEIITDGQTGWLVPPDDAEALAAALVQAVNDTAERRRRGALAYTTVHAQYSWPRLGAQLARTYEALCSPPAVT